MDKLKLGIVFLVLVFAFNAQAYSKTDYLIKIQAVKTGFLDSLWNPTESWYEINEGYTSPAIATGVTPYTWLNSYMVTTISIQAGQGVATATDITRCKQVIDKLLTAPAYSGGTWYHSMRGERTWHPALDSEVVEALYYAWKYRVELALSEGQIAGILDATTVDKVVLHSLGGYTGDHTLVNTDQWQNQELSKWHLHRLVIAYKMGRTDLASSISLSLKRFLEYADKEAPLSPNTKISYLFPDYGFRYLDEWPYSTHEYVCISYGGAADYYSELSSIFNLDNSQISRMKAWSRATLGIWQTNGYLNWDTVYSQNRLHSLSYWTWSIRYLMSVANNPSLNMNTNDSANAKWLLDRTIDMHTSMDTWAGDSQDGAVAKSPIVGVISPNSADVDFNINKGSANARFIKELAVSVDRGIADASSVEPKSLWTWRWYDKSVTVSTNKYSASSLPWTPRPPEGNGVEMQNWGLSRINLPDNQMVTALGGYGLEAFSLRLRRDGVTEMDTSVDVPTDQVVSVDNKYQFRVPYSELSYRTDFDAAVSEKCSKQGANYKVEVSTTFYHDFVRQEYQSTLTGTGGLGEVLLSIPLQEGGTVTYAPKNGGAVTVWNGATVQAAPSPSEAKYIHVSWPTKGLLIIPVNSAGLVNGSTTMLGYVPRTNIYRQAHQDRSIILYLASNAPSMGSLSFTYDTYVTDGSQSAVDAIYKQYESQIVRTWDGSSWQGNKIKAKADSGWMERPLKVYDPVNGFMPLLLSEDGNYLTTEGGNYYAK